jgi:hypothetical protein
MIGASRLPSGHNSLHPRSGARHLPRIISTSGFGHEQFALGEARKRRNYDELAKPLVEVQLVQVQPGQSRSAQAGSACCHSLGDWRVRSVHSE